MKKFVSYNLPLILLFSGCSPEVGSEKWCLHLKDKAKDEWTISELKDYSKHCLFR